MGKQLRFKGLLVALAGLLSLLPEAAFAEGLSDGNTAWILTSTALVLFMTLTGVFVSAGLGGAGFAEGVGMGQALGNQALGVASVFVWSAVVTLIIVKVTTAVTGLRVSDEEITDGLDVTAHGERGYSL